MGHPFDFGTLLSWDGQAHTIRLWLILFEGWHEIFVDELLVLGTLAEEVKIPSLTSQQARG